MPTFRYEPLLLSLKPKTLDEEKDKGNTDSAWPSNTKTTNEELRDLKGGKDSSKRKNGGKTYASK